MAARGANSPIPTIEICKPDGSNKRVVNQKSYRDLYAAKGYMTRPAWKKKNGVQLTDEEMKAQEAVNALMGPEKAPEGSTSSGSTNPLSSSPPNPEDTHPNGKDPIDPPMTPPPVGNTPPVGGR